MKNNIYRITFILLVLSIYACTQPDSNHIAMESLYPWCIVAYDSLERTPTARVAMIKELGFTKYAYDWRDIHLDSAASELELAIKNDIEVISVWLWLNAKRDSLGKLSPSNEKMLEIVKDIGLETCIWVSMSGNFFKGKDEEVSLETAVSMIEYVAQKVKEQGCEVALYNHSGWFGDPYNQLKVIDALPEYNLSLVYNFHHGQQHIDAFAPMVKAIKPYLSAVNLNGMEKNGEKILEVGKGSNEKEMIQILIDEDYTGPWGVMGHVEDADVKAVLEHNLNGLHALGF